MQNLPSHTIQHLNRRRTKLRRLLQEYASSTSKHDVARRAIADVEAQLRRT